MMMRWLAVLGILFQLAFSTTPALATQSGPAISGLSAEVNFAEKVTFRLAIQPAEEFRSLALIVQGEGQQQTTHDFDLKTANSLGELSLEIEVAELSLLPFTQITYHYEAILASGKQMRSNTQTFDYDDDRFLWKHHNSSVFDVYWYDDDAALGNEIANIAQLGLDRAQSVLLADPPNPLRIYAYSKSSELQSALQITGKSWVAGHATPQVGMIFISVPAGPERKLELERQIPHEIMHILQYKEIGNSVEQQPLWLIEGMASLAELYPNPEYSDVLESAALNQQLIHFEDLCSSLPRENAAAFQAYAQSDSFARYLQEKYGASGLRSLMQSYRNNMGCAEGVESALGVPLIQIEKQWQQEVLGVNQADLVVGNLSPYLFLGLLLLIPAAAVIVLPFRFGDEEDEA